MLQTYRFRRLLSAIIAVVFLLPLLPFEAHAADKRGGVPWNEDIYVGPDDFTDGDAYLRIETKPGERVSVSVRVPGWQRGVGVYLEGLQQFGKDPVRYRVPSSSLAPDSGERLMFRSPAGGPYILHIENREPGPEAFVRVETLKSPPPTVRPLEPGKILRGMLDEEDALTDRPNEHPGYRYELFEFEGQEGQQLGLDLIGYGGPNVSAHLYDPYDLEVRLEVVSGGLAATLPHTGRYRVRVEALRPGGPFALRTGPGFSLPEHIRSENDGYVQPLVHRVPARGRLDAQSVTERSGAALAAHSFRGRRGQPVTLKVSADGVQPHLLLFDARKRAVAGDHDSAPGSKAEVKALLPEDGEYTVMVIGDWTQPQREATYTLELDLGEPVALDFKAPKKKAPAYKGHGTTNMAFTMGLSVLDGDVGLGASLAPAFGYQFSRLFGVDVPLAISLSALKGQDDALYPSLSLMAGPGVRVGTAQGPFVRVAVAPSLRIGKDSELTLGPTVRMDLRLEEARDKAWSGMVEVELHEDARRLALGIGTSW